MHVCIQSRANFTICFSISLKDLFKVHSVLLSVSSMNEHLIHYFKQLSMLIFLIKKSWKMILLHRVGLLFTLA